MAKKRTDWTVITEMQLIKRAHSDPSAEKALKEVQGILAAGGSPTIKYSEFHGYRVIDSSKEPPK